VTGKEDSLSLIAVGCYTITASHGIGLQEMEVALLFTGIWLQKTVLGC
jgi:hypothetical protein